MATKLTLDDDVATKLKHLCQRTGEGFRASLYRILRDGLNIRRSRKPDEPFRVSARSLGLRPGVRLDCITELSEHLDGPGHA